jgi:16S rRNA A1518/A1519 N6-dimethyltransferase RsmA/KsgA/DIM1 with predicted DNA glycosylase/AP lyase activity
MKKLLLLSITACALLVSSVQQAKAQATDVTSAVTVNITLSDAISIDLSGVTPSTVNFVYANAADYAASKTVLKPGQLTVVSNKPYNISVAATGSFTGSGTETLALGIVSVAVVSPASGTPTARALTGGIILANAAATTTQAFDVSYTIADASSLIAVPAGTYSNATVIYTATQL